LIVIFISNLYASQQVFTGGVQNFSNTGLSKNTIYYYRVKATNANGSSVYSNEANAKTLK
jgi:hypothetical protein